MGHQREGCIYSRVIYTNSIAPNVNENLKLDSN